MLILNTLFRMYRLGCYIVNRFKFLSFLIDKVREQFPEINPFQVVFIQACDRVVQIVPVHIEDNSLFDVRFAHKKETPSRYTRQGGQGTALAGDVLFIGILLKIVNMYDAGREFLRKNRGKRM